MQTSRTTEEVLKEVEEADVVFISKFTKEGIAETNIVCGENNTVGGREVYTALIANILSVADAQEVHPYVLLNALNLGIKFFLKDERGTSLMETRNALMDYLSFLDSKSEHNKKRAS